MTAPRDPDVLIAAFLDEGQTDLPDRTFDAVRRDIHQTRQRAVIGSWREPDMSMLARVAIAAVAVLAVGLAWVNFGPGQPGIGAQPTATPSPTSTLPIREQVSPLQSGTYVTQAPFPVRVTFTAPDGWKGYLGSPYFAIVYPVNGSVGVIFATFEKVVADPCHFDQGFVTPQVGPSVDDLATALTRMPGVTATRPTDVTLSGYAGKQLTVTAPTSFAGCSLSPDGYVLWQGPLGGNYIVEAGDVSRLWILDVDGNRLVIDILTPDTPGQTAQERADAQAILDSIRIAPAN
jgi:type IV secretory pathway protease TraF